MSARPLLAALLASLIFATAPLMAAPTVEDALKLAPVQPGIEYDVPTADEANLCKINVEKQGGQTAWVVRGADGAILRQFSDSNNDNFVDTWSYFRSGLEIYRDADQNFNNKADQYRWYHTAGSRWGVDQNEDGKIDFWKTISAEEAAEEVVAALRAKDAARFNRLLLTKDEIASLGLSKEMADKLIERLASAPKTFAKLVADAKLDSKAEFTDFGGLRPGAVPAGVRGASKDLLVYEDAWAMALSGENHVQLQLGSMINVDDSWKLIDGPAVGTSDSAVAGFFYDVEGAAPQAPIAALNEPTEAMQKILDSIEKIDAQLAEAAADKKPALNTQRADLLEKLAEVAPAEEKQQWLMQLADMISFAAQDGSYPEGLERLKKLETKLADDKAGEDVLTHVEFRRMQGEWIQSQADPKADYAKIQEAWFKQLEEFVEKHKTSEHVAEALLQLAMASEFAGNNEEAVKSYERLVKDFPKNPSAVTARGAVRRLTAPGKPLTLKGPDVSGRNLDLAQYRGKTVLVHYWSTNSTTCKTDHEALADVFKKFGGNKLDIIGVSLDNSKDELVKYLKANPQLRWRQIFEPGGLQSRLANEMGIITWPMLVLVDDKGVVVSTSVQIAELEAELQKLFEARVAKAK